MILAFATANSLLEQLVADLASGQLRIYEREPSGSQSPLVSIPLGPDAFGQPSAGQVTSKALPAAVIEVSGQAGWADLVSRDGTRIGALIVRAMDARDVRSADLILDRVDFQRGGICQIDSITLQLPVVSDPAEG